MVLVEVVVKRSQQAIEGKVNDDIVKHRALFRYQLNSSYSTIQLFRKADFPLSSLLPLCSFQPQTMHCPLIRIEYFSFITNIHNQHNTVLLTKYILICIQLLFFKLFLW